MSEWGPWIEHDGSGQPASVRGKMIRVINAGGGVIEVIASPIPPMDFQINCWDWADCDSKGDPWAKVISYRIRKPRGMAILESLLADLPQEVDA